MWERWTSPPARSQKYISDQSSQPVLNPGWLLFVLLATWHLTARFYALVTVFCYQHSLDWVKSQKRQQCANVCCPFSLPAQLLPHQFISIYPMHYESWHHLTSFCHSQKIPHSNRQKKQNPNRQSNEGTSTNTSYPFLNCFLAMANAWSMWSSFAH